MADYQLTQPGATIQQAINKALEIEGELQTEITDREAADALLATKTELQAEATARQNADDLKANASALTAETQRAEAAEQALAGRATAIEGKIPSGTTDQNHLVNMNELNDAVSTASANYISYNGGPFPSVSALNSYTGQHDLNDYAFVESTDAAGNTVFSRYKFNGSAWVKEYDINNTGFTTAQWATINSGMISADKTKIDGISAGAQVNIIESVKVNVTALTPASKAVDVAVPTQLSQLSDDTTHRLVTDTEKTTWDGKYAKPSGGIPKTDMASDVQASLGNADTAYQKPGTGIPASDIAPGVIPTVPTDTVKYTEQTLTTEQKTQARTNIGSASQEEVSQLSQDIDGIPANCTVGYRLSSSNNLVADPGYAVSEYIDVPAGTFSIYYANGVSLNGKYLVFVDSNGDFVSSVNENVSGGRTVEIPSGAAKFRFTFDTSREDARAAYNNTTFWSPVYHVAGLTERVSKLEDDLETTQENIDSEIDDINDEVDEIKGVIYKPLVSNYAFTKNLVYTGTVGNAVTSETRTDNHYYGSIVASGINQGDSVYIKSRSGSSYATYGLTLSGVIVFVSDKNLSVDTTLVCDGTFDGVFVNNYYNTEANTILRVTKYIPINEEVGEIEQAISEIEAKTIKILCFGNSFTQDSFGYAPFIVKDIYPLAKLTIGIAYIGGAPLAQHTANFTGENQTVGGTTYSPTDYTYYKYSNNATAWEDKGSKGVSALLADENWDIITFQQSGNTSYASWDTYYAPFIFKLSKAVYDQVSNKNVKLGWILTHGTYSSSPSVLLERWEGTKDNAKTVLETTPFSIVFPYGTAVQNLRTTSLASLGDNGNLQADTAHLQEGIPSLVANYTTVLKIYELLGINKGILGNGIRPDKSWITAKGIPGPNYGESDTVVGVTDDNCYLAQFAAIKAVQSPFEVTSITELA